jgi:hypothetical protein
MGRRFRRRRRFRTGWSFRKEAEVPEKRAVLQRIRSFREGTELQGGMEVPEGDRRG